MKPALASLFDSLDGASYFFVSSGIFVLVTAAVFFGAGLWLGRLTWGRYRQSLEVAREEITEAKNEIALLKRRAAEQVARPLPAAARNSASAPNLALTALIRPLGNAPAPVPASRAFTLWTAVG